MNNSLLSKFSKRHGSDHRSSLHRKENNPEENRTTVAHTRQPSSFVDSDALIYCYLFIMLFYSIWSDSRLCFRFLLHCSIEMQYKKVFYKYLHSKDSCSGSIYTKGNIKVSYTKLVSASCIFKWRIGHKIVESIFSIWIWNEWWIYIFYVQSRSSK